MKYIVAICIAAFSLSACGDDAYEYQEPAPQVDFEANLQLVRSCIESGGDPEYATGIGDVVTVFYGCRP